jgi:hypothetical protein
MSAQREPPLDQSAWAARGSQGVPATNSASSRIVSSRPGHVQKAARAYRRCSHSQLGVSQLTRIDLPESEPSHGDRSGNIDQELGKRDALTRIVGNGDDDCRSNRHVADQPEVSVAMLFAADGAAVFLSINQGSTSFEAGGFKPSAAGLLKVASPAASCRRAIAKSRGLTSPLEGAAPSWCWSLVGGLEQALTVGADHLLELVKGAFDGVDITAHLGPLDG